MIKLRLIDAVIVAAVALLSLKVLGIAGGSQSAVAPAERTEQAGENLPAFGRVIAHARSNARPIEVTMTGTVAGQPDGSNAAPPAEGDSVGEAEAPSAPASPSERALLERLGERREEWQQRNRELETRERLLENAERKLEARINDLKGLEDKADAAAKRGEAEGGGLRNLVTMYEAMKPKDAARVFDRLSHDVLVPVVLLMNPRKMAEVLAAMSPEAAERLTVALATRANGKAAPPDRAAGTALPPNELPAIDPPGRP